MPMTRVLNVLLLSVMISVSSSPLLAKKRGNGDDEYSGRHNQKNVSTAVASKAFSWLSGSPADNEKLSVGKSAQFFGFVALRYQSDRTARRGALGQAFHLMATEKQRLVVMEAAKEEAPIMQNWWAVRNQVLRQLEHHLYTSEAIDESKVFALGADFGWLNAHAGLIEATACATVESSLSSQQWQRLKALRQDPALASRNNPEKLPTQAGGNELSSELTARYEDIFAKCLAYLTGSLSDREVIPLGQPAQFFGFVSIRHKSGRGVKRGEVAKKFSQILDNQQHGYLHTATEALLPEIKQFKELRGELLRYMDRLRAGSKKDFDLKEYQQLAFQLGVAEIRCAIIEAISYRKIRASLTDSQQAQMMALRSDYMLNDKANEALTGMARGRQLYRLCAGCHQADNPLAPSLAGIIDRPMASKNFDYSDALKQQQDKIWTKEKLDTFIASPDKVIPGNKMGFAGLLNPDDRQALISYLLSVN